MNIHRGTVPFPTTHHHEDPPLVVPDRPSVPPRLHSTPSLPNIGIQHIYRSSPSAPFPPQPSGPLRPHLRPLDLASSPLPSPTKKDPSFELLLRQTILLTPPLTPSSSFNSNSNDTPSTPPEQRSPLRWPSASERERVLAAAHSTYSAGIKNFMSSPVGGTNAAYPTPTSALPQSADPLALAPTSATTPDISVLASGLTSSENTPRDERTFSLGAQTDLDIGETSETATRLLMVRRVPPTAPSTDLRQAFSGLGDVKGILARFQANHGVVILAFYDTRHAARALRHITAHTFPVLDNVHLEAAFVSPAHVQSMMAQEDFISELDGSFFVTVEGRAVESKDVQKMLASFGELASFSASGSDPCDQSFHVDFCDCRDALNAYNALNNRTIFGARLTLVSNKDALDHTVRMMHSTARSSSPGTTLPRDAEDRIRPRSVSASEGVGTPDAVRRQRQSKEASQDRGRRPSNDLSFDAVGKALDPSHPAVSRPRSISASAENPSPAAKMQPPVNGYLIPGPHYPYPEPPYGYAHPATLPVIYGAHGAPSYAYPAAVYPSDMGMYMGDRSGVGPKGYWTYAAPPLPQMEYYPPHASRTPMYPPLVATAAAAASTAPRAHAQGQAHDLRARDPPYVSLPFPGDQPHSPTAADRALETSQPGGQRLPGSKNIVDVAAIESGVDTRTTVMIKNIPNKMSDQDLLNFINRVCPRRIDFMYLRMDFQNGCNVGYAFVNFITVQDLLHFAKTQLGVKWNMYSSEKVLQMCYATYQGKESLVEKFKNSSIMDEREAWRPKIFYSDGPDQGLPEPFPAPTHLRRKERSQNNRGALFVPGTHHPSGGGLHHHRPRPLHMSAR
ncbi:RNA recognition motif 2-domain-containing protein [Trametes gibbosa]|nr:RNA recognition motif 2-domain-containing protein [Trametes gibbosa]